MSLAPQTVQHLRDILEAGFPEFTGFADPRFTNTETDYKREASEKAQTWFSRTALEALIENEPDALIQRIRDLANETNLLFLGVPRQGDLALIYSDGLDTAELGRRILDLLHGPDESPARLQRFSEWVDRLGFPNRWTFPTYLLFLVHPDTEFFVKPRAVSDFLKLAGSDVELGSSPSGTVYERLLGLAAGLKDGLADLSPGDMIDVQSVVFLAHVWGRDMELSDEQHKELVDLIDEFRTDYVQTDTGTDHLARYSPTRQAAISNFRNLQDAKKQGQELTNLTLLKLLPYKDSPSNRERGAWISLAPAVQGDIRQWFENKGWVEPGNWPKVAYALLEFVEDVKERPDDIEAQVSRLVKSNLSTGFQSGMLSPILNALRPDRFIVLNAKSRQVINYFLGLKYEHTLSDYPALNRAGRYLINCVRTELADALPQDSLPSDGFDAFCHWLVAVRKYAFGKARAWRVQISDVETWTRWSEAGLIGYPDLGIGDASARTPQEWRTPAPGIDLYVADAVRYLASRITEGDHVVVFDDASVVRGVGVASGGYEYREDQDFAHVVPVAWYDTTARKSTGRPHKKLIKKMDPTAVGAVQDLPELETDGPTDTAFTHQTFQLLAGLTETPKKRYYEARRDEFNTHLEDPFKRLLQSVAAELPQAMRDVLETEKRLFSKVLKNDFGRGGAWDFYWGALYPKDQKRIAAAQLFIWINRNRLEWGFYVGEYADKVSEGFLTQFRRRREALRAILREHIADERYLFGAERGADGELIAGERRRVLGRVDRPLGRGFPQRPADLTAGRGPRPL